MVEFLGETVPTASDSYGIVEVKFIVGIGDLALERFGNVFLVHGEDQYFIVGKERLAYSLTEAKPVKAKFTSTVDVATVLRPPTSVTRTAMV